MNYSSEKVVLIEQLKELILGGLKIVRCEGARELCLLDTTRVN